VPILMWIHGGGWCLGDRSWFGDLGRRFAEAGIGVAAFSRKDLGNKNFSTHFQFTEQVNVGLRFAERWSAAVGYAHYSNADIKTPNDGIDMYQAVLGIAF